MRCTRNNALAQSRPRPGRLAMPPYLACVRFRSAKRAKALVGAATHQSLEAKAYSVGVCLRARGRPGLAQQVLVDVQRLLHPSNYANLSADSPPPDTRSGSASPGGVRRFLRLSIQPLLARLPGR